MGRTTSGRHPRTLAACVVAGALLAPAAADAVSVTQSLDPPSWARAAGVCQRVDLTSSSSPSGVSGPFADGYDMYGLTVTRKRGVGCSAARRAARRAWASGSGGGSRTTIACFPTARAAPSSCTVYALPGRVVGPATANGVVRVRLTRIRWSGWGRSSATGRARLRVDGRLRSVRLRASGRETSAPGSAYYTRLRITRAGRSQTLGLDATTERS